MTRLKKGDSVIVIAGKDKGKKGKVASVNSLSGRVVIDGVNLYQKHSRPKQQGQKGETVHVPRAISESKVMPFCSNCGKGARVGSRMEGEKRVRFCRRCNISL